MITEIKDRLPGTSEIRRKFYEGTEEQGVWLESVYIQRYGEHHSKEMKPCYKLRVGPLTAIIENDAIANHHTLKIIDDLISKTYNSFHCACSHMDMEDAKIEAEKLIAERLKHYKEVVDAGWTVLSDMTESKKEVK